MVFGGVSPVPFKVFEVFQGVWRSEPKRASGGVWELGPVVAHAAEPFVGAHAELGGGHGVANHEGQWGV